VLKQLSASGYVFATLWSKQIAVSNIQWKLEIYFLFFMHD
jgi:hypothetical protein